MPGRARQQRSLWNSSTGVGVRHAAGAIESQGAGVADGPLGETGVLWEYLRCFGAAASGVCVVGVGDV